MNQFAARRIPPDPATPNCANDEPYEYSALLSAANNPDTTFESFLRGLPPRAMNTFTLVYESQSPEREDVTPLSPRVIRSSADGRLVIAYVCNPTSSKYGEVQVMKFDDDSRQFKTAVLTLKTSPNEPIAPERRVVENPRVCLSCHSNGPDNRDPKAVRPIWEHYPRWPGVYGSGDDFLDNTPSENANYRSFLQQQANNPCYSTLPWSFRGTSGQYPNFPYASQARNDQLGVRPNTRFIKAWDKLNNLRLIRRTRNQMEPVLGSQRTQDLLMLLLSRDIHGCTDDYSISGRDDEAYGVPERCSLPSGNCLYRREIQETIAKIVGPRPAPLIQAILNKRSPASNEMALDLGARTDIGSWPEKGFYAPQPVQVITGSQYLTDSFHRALIDELGVDHPDLLQAAIRAIPQELRGFSVAASYGEDFSCLDYQNSSNFSVSSIVEEGYHRLPQRNYELCELVYTKVKAIERRYRVSNSRHR